VDGCCVDFSFSIASKLSNSSSEFEGMRKFSSNVEIRLVDGMLT
jgi:hypothetical protein